MADDVDRDPRHLVGPRAGRRERAAEVGERLPRLRGEVAGRDEVVVGVLGHLAGDVHGARAGRDDDVRVRAGDRKAVGLDELERHLRRSLVARLGVRLATPVAGLTPPA